MRVATARVLYADTDQMGVVNHATYLRWFEQARAEWLRRLGYTYREMEGAGVMLPIYELQVRYLKPARYDDVLELYAHLAPPTVVRLIFSYQIRRAEDGELLITGTTSHASIDRNGRPIRMPATLRTLIERGVADQGPQDGDA